MNAAVTLLLIDIISPRRALRVRQHPQKPQISEAGLFISPEEADERKTTR